MSTVATPFRVNDSLLGEIVSWHMSSAEIPVSEIRDALSKAGLDPDIAKDLNNRSAFSRAIKELKENRSIDKVRESKDGKIEFQLTRKEIDSHLMKFDYETTITLDTKTGDLDCPNIEIEAKARSLFTHAMAHRTSSDVTRLGQKLFKDNADLFPINPAKGVAYFVPEQHKDFTGKVDLFFHGCGGSISRFPIPKGTSEGNRSVREAVSGGLETMVKELEESVESWGDDTRADTMARAIEKYRTVKHKVESYSEYLQFSKNELDEKVRVLKERMIVKAKEKTSVEKGEPAVA